MRNLGPVELLRRDVLLGLGALVAGSCASNRHAERAPLAPPAVDGPPPQLAPPDLLRAPPFEVVVGQRPYRRGRVRLELEWLRGRPWVHNYGHGGAGLTLAMGSALEVRRLVGEHVAPGAPVAVLGAGAVGLAAALELLRGGYRVSVHAEHFGPRTTSAIAGGQWAPSLVAKGDDAASRALYLRVLADSRRAVHGLLARGAGVHERWNFAPEGHGASLFDVPDAILPPAVALERLPWPGTPGPGWARRTYLIEPRPFLGWLERQLHAGGVPFQERRFDSAEQIDGLPADAIVNCLGEGAGALLDDREVRPLRGQLLHFAPEAHPWLLSYADGYVFPRSDALVLGGSVESGRPGLAPDPELSERILARGRAFFRSSADFGGVAAADSGRRR